MAETDIFLAIKVPRGELKYYIPSPNSPNIFHFQAWSGDYIQVPMEETAAWQDVPCFFGEEQYESSKEEYLNLLQQAIGSLKDGQATKVVLSRCKKVSYNKELENIVSDLAELYPNACVYLFIHPEAGTWFGASPENLVSIENSVMKTSSLAGTKSWEERKMLAQKELEEQGIVTQTIYDDLRFAGLEDIEIGQTEVLRAGHLAHFHTEIKARVPKQMPLLDLANVIHPSPAVGGMPKTWSREFINRMEGQNRRYYTGFYGWFNSSMKEARFWVNLRCAEVIGDKEIALYIGGGITADSNAEAEWQETENKALTILKVLN